MDLRGYVEMIQQNSNSLWIKWERNRQWLCIEEDMDALMKHMCPPQIRSFQQMFENDRQQRIQHITQLRTKESVECQILINRIRDQYNRQKRNVNGRMQKKQIDEQRQYHEEQIMAQHQQDEQILQQMLLHCFKQ